MPMHADRAVWRFLSVGLVNTLIGLSTIYVCMALLGMQDVPSNVTGYMIGLVVSFVLNKHWTFRYHGDALESLLRFLVVFAIAYSANLIVVLCTTRVFGVDRYVAQAAGVLAYTVLSYLGSRHYAFRPRWLGR